jgi:hypothetical protein
MPTYAAVAEISVVPDAKTQFKVQFRPMRVVPSLDHLQAIKTRLDSARQLGLEPYAETSDPDDEEQEAPPPKPALKSSKKF